MSGTSMAGPHVTGAVALLWSARPALKHQVASTEQILSDSAVHISSSACSSSGWPNNTYGYGRLDVKAAVDAGAGPTPTPTTGPTPTNTPTITPTPTNTPVPPVLPNAPSNLVATAISRSQINLSWMDNATNETGFRIERCKGSTCTNFAQIATVGADVTSYSNTKLTASTTYRYRVLAYNESGNSAYSNIAAATTPRR